jgi:2-isopropylmalate synthase
MSDKEKLIIFDTTMRDGEQSPGAAMNMQEKLLIAECLDQMGVDVIEAGFAIASAGDAKAINEVAKIVKNAAVCSLARAKKADIEAAAEAIKPAKRRKIHTFLSTSPVHMKHKLKMDEKQVLEAIFDSVSYARKFVADVDWSPEDATRTEHDFLCQTIETAIKAGANVINIPDTVGYSTPDEMFELITMIKNRVHNIDKAILSVHCHNDLGLAVANSLAAVQAGARQIECTINGIGERAGNAALEEIIMAIKTRNDRLQFDCGIDTRQITRASRLVSKITGFMVQKNKAIVGANAFAHASGIHQDGMLKNSSTYEIMTPESVGLGKSSLVLSKLSGRAAFRDKLIELGFNLSDNTLGEVFARFKDLADKKKDIYDNDIIALVSGAAFAENPLLRFESLEVVCGSKGSAKAKIELLVNGEMMVAEASGDGPVDATFKAIRSLIPHDAKLQLYQVDAVTEGTDAQAEVLVRLEKNGNVFDGHAAHTDTMAASAMAYVNALGNMNEIAQNERIKAQG